MIFYSVPDVVFLFDRTGLYTVYCDELPYDESSSLHASLLPLKCMSDVRTCVCIVILLTSTLYIRYSLYTQLA